MLRVRRLPRQDVRSDDHACTVDVPGAINDACALTCADDNARADGLLPLQPDARCRRADRFQSWRNGLDLDHGTSLLLSPSCFSEIRITYFMLTRLPPRRLLKGLHRRGLGSRINLGELLEGVRLFVRRTAVSFVYWLSSS